MRHNFLGAEICHRNNAAALFHERTRCARYGNQRVDTHVVGHAEPFARCTYKISLEFFGGRVSHAVHEDVQLSITFLEFREDLLDVLVLGNITHEGFGAGQRQNQVFGLLLETLVLVGDRQLSAGLMQSLGDRPGNASFVGDSEDDGHTAFEAERHRFSWSE